MLTIKAMTGGETYARNHLSNNDYYSVGESITGQWLGRGAQLLGLNGAVEMDQFDAIRQGINPATGEFLRQRVSADRHRDGEKIGTARNLYDFTISAPKAISVQAMEDPRLVAAHLAAVTEAAAEIETVAGTRIRRGGANDSRTTGNLVIARYDHDTSRELDPQLHTHLVAANLTYDGVEGRWKALQASEMYEQRDYLSEVYRNALAREVRNLGYAIEDRKEHGKDRGFGITGIQEATLEKYSRRSAQRDREIEAFIDANGRKPSNAEIAVMIRESRPEKLHEISGAEVKARQLARLDPAEALQLRQLRQGAPGGAPAELHPPGPSLDHAREHIFERLSVARDHEVKAEALRHGRGTVELDGLKSALSASVHSGQMLSAGNELATRESLARERWMVDTINAGVGAHERLGRNAVVTTTGLHLRPEQAVAVRFVMDSRDLAVNLRGAAGTGKTATLQELRRGLLTARRSIVAVAPTASAVEELRKVGFAEATTIARLLTDDQARSELSGQVIVVDEAGMVASKDMASLLALAKNSGARIVFSGDTAQIKAVSEGDALRILERESRLSGVSLLQVQRQTTAEYKAAVETLRYAPATGFDLLEKMGAVHEVDWRLRSAEVASAYRVASAAPNQLGKQRSVLVVAATHDEIRNVTYAIRKDRARARELGQGVERTVHTPLNWTEAQKRRPKNYQPGQMLEFHRAVKGIEKDTALEVVSADRAGVLARKPDGQTVRITQRQAGAYSVYERESIEVAPGDKLLLQANRHHRRGRLTNGEIVEVGGVDSTGAIALTDGRNLPADYRQFSHGYAVTAHRSQGKTVDFTIIAAERMTHDLFYVSASRAREGLIVVTSDSLSLQESIGISGERQSATELSQNAKTRAARRSISHEELLRAYEANRAATTPELIRSTTLTQEPHNVSITNSPPEHHMGI